MKLLKQSLDHEVLYEGKETSFDIAADDGRPLFTIRVSPDGSLEINSGSFVKHGGVMLDGAMLVLPRASNAVTIKREVYTP
jgi:hypothetical protein